MPLGDQAHDSGRPRRGVHLAVVALVATLLAAFVALGVWQLERRAWKLALIDRVERRVHAAAVAAPGRDAWRGFDAAAEEYRHVRVSGRFDLDRTTFVVASTDEGRGFWAITPLRTDDGGVVLVNRGFVQTVARSLAPPSAVVVVTGLLRPSEPRGSLLHANDPTRDRWYSRDVEAIANARGLAPVAPYFIDADAGATPSSPGAAPIGGLTVVEFRNDHLGYAATWFTLAGLCGWALRLLAGGRGTRGA